MVNFARPFLTDRQTEMVVNCDREVGIRNDLGDFLRTWNEWSVVSVSVLSSVVDPDPYSGACKYRIK